MSSFQMTGSFIISFNRNVFVAHPVLIVHKSFKGHDDDPERERAAVHSKVKNLFLKFRNILSKVFLFSISNQYSQIYWCLTRESEAKDSYRLSCSCPC